MARQRTGDIKVTGLAELNKALKAIGPDARKELKQASKRAADLVAGSTTSTARSLGGVAAHAAPSIKATASMTGSAAVSIGGPGYEMAGGAAFGGRGRPTTQQFQPFRGRQGYFLYPDIRDNADEIESVYVSAIDDIIKRRFPE